MIKAKLDKNGYQHLTLSNHLSLLQTTTPDTELAAICCTIGCGSLHDPDELPGAMHLLEHMLFGGSKHYPEHNEVMQWAENLPGSLNAWTSLEYTSFVIQVPATYLVEAVRRFLDMLCHPLFSDGTLQTELQSIHAEFLAKKKDEIRRIQDVHKATCNQQHPFSRFSVGNNDVFQSKSEAELKAILHAVHSENYVAGNMKVALVSPELSDDVQSAIVDLFEQIPGGKATGNNGYSSTPLHLDEQLGREIHICPAKQYRQLILSFDVSHLQKNGFDLKPDSLVSHLIGYEGKHSLLCYWKMQGWATQVIAGTGIEGEGFKEFNINIQLTELGQSQCDIIVASVFYFIEQIKQDNELQRSYQEKQHLNELAFQFSVKQNAANTAQQLSLNMWHYPEEYWLYGEFAMTEFNRSDIMDFLDCLRPEKLRKILISPEVLGTSTSPFYQVPFTSKTMATHTFNEDQAKGFGRYLALPKPNPYLPNVQLGGTPNQDVTPAPISHHSEHVIYFGHDNVIEPGRGECYLSYLHSGDQHTLLNIAQRKLWIHILQSQLNEMFYDAQISGTFFHLYSHQNGFGLHTSGFSDNQLKLANNILDSVSEMMTADSQFVFCQQQLNESLHNSLLNKPLNKLFAMLQCIVVPNVFLPEDVANAITQCTPEDLCNHRDHVLENSRIEGLIYGDWDINNVRGFIDHYEFPNLKNFVLPDEDIVQLSDIEATSVELGEMQHEAACVVYLQGSSIAVEEQAIMMLLESYLASFYFNWMRNNKNLGYIVGTGYMPFNGFPGISMYVQSPSATPETIYLETIACLKQFLHWLKEIQEPSWQDFKHHLVAQVARNDVNLSIACQRMWTSVAQKDAKFNRLERLQKSISSIEKHQLVEYLGFLQHPESRLFVLHTPLANSCDKPWSGNSLEDIYQFKEHA